MRVESHAITRIAVSLLGLVGALGFLASSSVAQDTSAAADDQQIGEIVVTGFRQSLEYSTEAKRQSVSFTDTIFAEDIGKFPDTNIAESFNRIPGITITREISGEGLNVAIRGLGTNFTRVLLNGAPVAIASTGRTDAQNTNREVDLDLFPTELFTQLTVNKTSLASQTEGGAAGTVDMRSARPFDKPGTRLVYSLQGTENSEADEVGARGSVLGSATFDNGFGVLAGVAAVQNKVRTTGFETIGWTNSNARSAATTRVTVSATNPQGYTDVDPVAPGVQIDVGPTCTTGCNGTGGGNWTIPALVPANAGNGLSQDQIIDAAFLQARNPGLTLQQIDNALIPRLGRPSDEFGDKDRTSAIVALEYRPTDTLHFYIDSMYGKKENDLERIDMNWVGRFGSVIPLNMTVDRSDCSNGCVVTGGTFANAQFFLEYRPFIEDTEFWGVNPGFDWEVNESLRFDLQGNFTESEFHRQSPTVLVNTPASSGVTVQYTNNGGIPRIDTNIDLNNPANFVWAGGRVNIQDEQRDTETKGARANLTWSAMDRLSVKFGGAYDDVSREIRAYDNSQFWQNAICGNGPSAAVPGPNTQPPCEGLSTTTPPANYPVYPGLGTGFSQGVPAPLTYSGSLIPQASLASYLRPGPSGFVTVDWGRLVADSNYGAFHNAALNDPLLAAGSSNTGASAGFVQEKVTAAYLEFNGNTDIGENVLRYNAGVRFARTDQSIGGRVTFPDNRNITATTPTPTPTGPCYTSATNGVSADGGCYPQVVNFVYTDNTYDDWLPSLNLALNLGDNAVARVGLSKTMTRPNPNTMLPGINFSSPSADTANIGNPALEPFHSDNIDLGFEYYTGDEGYIGFAAFRKGLDGFTVNNLSTVPFSSLSVYGITYNTLTATQQGSIDQRGGPNVATVVVTQQVNATGRLTVNGLEFNWVQPLGMLWDPLQGLGFTANYTLIDQKGEGAAPAVAVGVAPETYNYSIYYENYGISARISNTYAEGSQVAGFNQNGIPNAALFGDDYEQWDFAASFDFAKMLGGEVSWYPQLTIDVINLTDEEQRAYFQFPNATFTQYNPGRQIMVGLRGSFQ